MNDINEIKKQLDEFYKDYIDHKNNLSKEKTGKVVHFLLMMTHNKEAKEIDIAKELSRFSYWVCCRYFENLTKSTSTNIEIIDAVIKEMLSVDTDKTKSAVYAKKYSMTLNFLINNSNTNIFKSKMISKLLLFIVKATKTDNQKNDFKDLVIKTEGNIFLLDYSEADRSSLYALCQLTKSIYPDLSKCKYYNEISEWGNKYGYPMRVRDSNMVEISTSKTDNQITKTAEVNISINNEKSISEAIDNSSDTNIKEESNIKKENNISGCQTNSENNSVNVGNNEEKTASVIVKSDNSENSEVLLLISGESKKTRELISKELISLQNTVNSFKADLSKSMEVANNNAMLQRKIEKLESELETVKQVNDTQRIALEQLTKEKSEIEIKASEFEEQLKKAFDLDSRETENKADKVKFDILNAVKLSYENWTEYESAEYSEDNYESLKAIIKAIFRGLERNGINIKGID